MWPDLVWRRSGGCPRAYPTIDIGIQAPGDGGEQLNEASPTALWDSEGVATNAKGRAVSRLAENQERGAVETVGE